MSSRFVRSLSSEIIQVGEWDVIIILIDFYVGVAESMLACGERSPGWLICGAV
jgi:hypothetical protein